MDTITIDVTAQCEECGTDLDCTADIEQGGIIDVRVEPCPVCCECDEVSERRPVSPPPPGGQVRAELLALAEGLRSGQVTPTEAADRVEALASWIPTFVVRAEGLNDGDLRLYYFSASDDWRAAIVGAIHEALGGEAEELRIEVAPVRPGAVQPIGEEEDNG